MTARATTAAKPPPKPCTTRNAMSHPIDGATAHPTAPRVQTSAPTIIGLRRPRWSDNGPPSSCPRPRPRPRKNVVNVSPTSDAEVARSAVTRGKAGVYMSVANGGTALCNANVRISDVVTVALHVAVPAVVLVGGIREAQPSQGLATSRPSGDATDAG